MWVHENMISVHMTTCETVHENMISVHEPICEAVLENMRAVHVPTYEAVQYKSSAHVPTCEAVQCMRSIHVPTCEAVQYMSYVIVHVPTCEAVQWALYSIQCTRAQLWDSRVHVLCTVYLCPGRHVVHTSSCPPVRQSGDQQAFRHLAHLELGGRLPSLKEQSTIMAS